MNPLTFLFLQMSLASDRKCFLGDMNKCLLTLVLQQTKETHPCKCHWWVNEFIAIACRTMGERFLTEHGRFTQ